MFSRINDWYYVSKLGEKQNLLHPGDMGWPIIGNMLSFVKAFKSQDPESFINDLIKRLSVRFIYSIKYILKKSTPNSFLCNINCRHGRTGIYKSHLFWRPTIIVCSPETCKRVLTDNDTFSVGYSSSVNQLAGKTSLQDVSASKHRDLRKLTEPSFSGNWK